METEYFDIVTGVLQDDTYLFIICLDYVLRTSIDLMKENDFKQRKEAVHTLLKLLRTRTTLMT